MKMKIPRNVRSFYKKHFPTDRESFNYRVPIINLILTSAFLYFISFSVGGIHTFRYLFGGDWNLFIQIWYVVIAACVTYELYYGLKNGDRKHYSFWIVLKTIEISWIVVDIISYCCLYNSSYNMVSDYYDEYYTKHYSLNNFVAELIFGIILLGINIWITYIILIKSYNEYSNGAPQIGNLKTKRGAYGISQGIFYINEPQKFSEVQMST